jgi:hypothetical protein
MPTSNTTCLTPGELEKHYIAPFIHRQFPFMPDHIQPHVTVVQPERTRIARNTAGHPLVQPAQYGYTYVYQDGDSKQIVYVLADAQGHILRALTSK